MVPLHFVSKGVHTAIEQAVYRVQTIRVEDGRITSATGYRTLAEALEAAVGG